MVVRPAALASATLGLLLTLATPSAAPAGGNQYFVSTANPAQATVIDLATKAQSGSRLSFTMGLLRKTPAHTTGADIYWADGVLQIECLDHQTRYKLVSSSTLDRSRRFDEPSPTFRPWSENASGSPARALEEFVCRGHLDSDFTPIASLSDFAAAFVGGKAIAQASPPGRPSAASAPPPLPPPPRAGAAPGALAPYYLTLSDNETAVLLDTAHITRKGSYATTTTWFLSTNPTKDENGDLYWTEGRDEFDCAGHRYREAIRALLTLDRQVSADSPVKTFGPWTQDKPNTVELDSEILVCEGKVQKSQIAVYDLTAFQRQFFASVKGQ